VFINLIGFIFVKVVLKNNLPQSIDFFFCLVNLSCIMPLLFCANTFFTFLFIVEVVSILLFYKFVVSKVWFKTNNNVFLEKKNKFTQIIPRYYLNILFFQF
jgi:hypothetical protein